jgi:hypothetical protein
MSRTNRKPSFERLYSVAELVELRRQMLRFSRSIPPGPDRNEHRQIATSLRWLFKNKAWLDAHTVEGSQKCGELTASLESRATWLRNGPTRMRQLSRSCSSSMLRVISRFEMSISRAAGGFVHPERGRAATRTREAVAVHGSCCQQSHRQVIGRQRQ